MTTIWRNAPGIDLKIRGVVKELNENSYRTKGSCAGHYKSHRGFVTLAPYKPELKEVFIKSPELIGWYQKVGNNYGDDADYIGYSQRPINVDHIREIFKKHHITPVYYERPKFSIKNGKLVDINPVHSFTFAPQQIERSK